MKNRNAIYKLISILMCIVFALLPMAGSLEARAKGEKSAGEGLHIGTGLASSEDEKDVLLYSFGLLADLHIQYETGTEDFKRALTYLKDLVPFTCVCGDLVSYATAENMAEYKEFVNAYAGDMPLFECAGNHDTYDLVDGEVKAVTLTDEMLRRWINATGKVNPNYSFEYGGDVFIFLSMKSDNPDDLFEEEGLKWFAETLEENKNKRCFVFQHVQDPEDKTADPSLSYSHILNGISGKEFLRLIKKYENAVWFHGHTHLTFQGEYTPINETLGYRSVHIPSLSSPRFYDEKSNVLENFYFDEYNRKIWGALLSEGYIVDVYADRIVLRGINFASGTDRNKVELLDNKVFTLNTTFTYTEPEEPTTSAPITEIETTIKTTEAPAFSSSVITETAESTSALPETSVFLTDPEETESISATEATDKLTDPIETQPTYTSSAETETDIDSETTVSSVSTETSYSEAETPICILGDSNSDGRVNIRDATFIRKVVARLSQLSETESKCADVNSDGKINVKDATIIQKYSANLESGFAVGLPV